MIDTSLREAAETAGILFIGVILLKLSSTAFTSIKNRTRKTATIWDDVVFEVFKRIAQFSIVTVVVLYFIRLIDHATVTTLLEIGLTVLGAYLAARAINYSFNSFQKHMVTESRTKLDDLVFPLLANIASVVIYLIALLIILDHLGYDVTALVAGMGIAGIAISLAAKDSISNAIAGIFLVLDKPFLPGDRIELWNPPPNQATWGDVVEIGLRSTKVKTTDNITIIIPNSQLMTRDIINYTQDASNIRIRIPVGVSYDSNLTTVAKVLTRTVKGIEGVLEDPGPQVVVKRFGDSSIDVELRVWIKSAKERRRIQDEINREIKIEFEQSSIEMPYPQREVRIREWESRNRKTI